MIDNEPIDDRISIIIDDWCPICREKLSECECTDSDFHNVYGDYDNVPIKKEK